MYVYVVYIVYVLYTVHILLARQIIVYTRNLKF